MIIGTGKWQGWVKEWQGKDAFAGLVTNFSGNKIKNRAK